MKIIYEDNHILVCWKPAGLATQTAKTGQRDMVSELKNHMSMEKRNRKIIGEEKKNTVDENAVLYLGVVHRLDQPVEGLLVFAKTKAAADCLSQQLREGTLNKNYYAVICGWPAEETGELVDYLYKDTARNRAEVVSGSGAKERNAKKSVLQYRIVQKVSEPEQMTLMDIHIDTGRFHQIRAQMSHAGMPIMGDGKYGGNDVLEKSGMLGMRYVALCAYKLAFQHPATGQHMGYEALPDGKAFSWFSICS